MKLELILIDRAMFQSAMISANEVVHCPLDLFFLLATFEPLRSKSEFFWHPHPHPKRWIKVSCFSETINPETKYMKKFKTNWMLSNSSFSLESTGTSHEAPALATERPTCHGADHPAVHTEGHLFCKGFRKCLH